LQIIHNEENQNLGYVRIRLPENELINVLHPGQIIAFQGPASAREDRLMNLSGLYRKRRWIKAILTGACEFVLGLPLGFRVVKVDIPRDSNLLFDFRYILFYSEGLQLKSKLQSVKTAFITKEWTRMKFTGPGYVGIITAGSIESMQLDPSTPLYVEAGCLLSYPEDASVKLSVYGNSLSSQHMKMQWEIKGQGPVLIQTASSDPQLENRLKHESILRRTLREVIPFGGIFIK
jgi:uncharacterized protein (AIM24 family)